MLALGCKCKRGRNTGFDAYQNTSNVMIQRFTLTYIRSFHLKIVLHLKKKLIWTRNRATPSAGTVVGQGAVQGTTRHLINADLIAMGSIIMIVV